MRQACDDAAERISMSAPSAGPVAGSADASQRGALTRALASESRNALAQVELAASELARSDLPPGLAGRVRAIRSAVDEIDGLLGKIDLLSDPSLVPDRVAVDVREVARGVFARLAPTLEARGVRLEWGAPSSSPGGFGAPISAPMLEALCVGLARLAAGATRADETLRIAVVERTEHVCVIAGGGPGSRGAALEPNDRLELEVALAEWGGQLLVGEDPTRFELGLALPRSDSGTIDPVPGGAVAR